MFYDSSIINLNTQNAANNNNVQNLMPRSYTDILVRIVFWQMLVQLTLAPFMQPLLLFYRPPYVVCK
jgi:hypothetical protein